MNGNEGESKKPAGLIIFAILVFGLAITAALLLANRQNRLAGQSSEIPAAPPDRSPEAAEAETTDPGRIIVVDNPGEPPAAAGIAAAEAEPVARADAELQEIIARLGLKDCRVYTDPDDASSRILTFASADSYHSNCRYGDDELWPYVAELRGYSLRGWGASPPEEIAEDDQSLAVWRMVWGESCAPLWFEASNDNDIGGGSSANLVGDGLGIEIDVWARGGLADPTPEFLELDPEAQQRERASYEHQLDEYQRWQARRGAQPAARDRIIKEIQAALGEQYDIQLPQPCQPG